MKPDFFSDSLVSVSEEALEHSPLRLMQVTIVFPTILLISQRSSPLAVSFQESVRADYPLYEAQGDSISVVHVFRSQDGCWEIMLNQDAILLSTNRPEVKKELVERLRKIAEVAKNVFGLNRVISSGIRFVYRVEDESVVNNLEKYVNPEFLSPFRSVTWGSDMQLYLNLPDDKATLNLRWGIVPPGQTMSNMPLSFHTDVSWVFSSDMHKYDFSGFDSEEIAGVVSNCSGRSYAIFRHVFNDDFIRLCGDKT